MVITHIIVALAWIVYCVLHSVFASGSFKGKARNRMGSRFRYYRLYYTLFAALSFAAVIFYLFIVPSIRFYKTSKLTIATGIILSSFGFAVMCVCNAKYFLQITGLKGLSQTKKSNELMITGIHRFVRHPLYTGTFIFIWGLLILFPTLSALITDLIITIYTLIGLRFEERKLEREFGAAYINYKKRVPMLIPRIN